MDKSGQRPNEAPNPDQPSEKPLCTNTKDPIDTVGKNLRRSLCNQHLSGENALLPDRMNFLKNREISKSL